MTVLLDTSMLIATWDPADDAEFAISIVSVAELHFGVTRAASTAASSARLRRLSEIEYEFDPIPVDRRVARAYAECAHAVTSVGRSPRPRAFDLLIAATALAEGATLYTLNPDDFAGLDDLVDVVTPST